jgi:hypothetical protein
MPPPPPPRNDGAALSDEQKSTVSDILSSYDAENLTESDAQAITEQLKNAGIAPSKSLETAMTEAGFDSKSLAELAGKERPAPPSSSKNLPDTATFSITV